MKIDRPSERRYQLSFKTPPTEFALTLFPDARLSRRLFAEIDFATQQIRNNWPKFKEDPFGSIGLAAFHLATVAKRTIARPQTAISFAISVVIVTCLIVTVLVVERRGGTRAGEIESTELGVVTTLGFESNPASQNGQGVGAGEKGRVGFERSRGEGSQPTPARAQGGGGGGTHSLLAASLGRLPLPSMIPAPIATAAVHLPQALPVAGIDLDPALYRKLDYSTYGDPRSKQTTASNGSGDGGGVGNGNGLGINEGDGSGFGPGHDGNMGGREKKPGGGGIGGSRGNNSNDDDDPSRVYKSPEVSTRPRVILKPEPQYTEQARRNQVMGTVVLRAVFSSTGQVTNIQAVQKLSDGLTEKAIAAARGIRFVPAMRNGHPVSMYMQLEYNFNLY